MTNNDMTMRKKTESPDVEQYEAVEKPMVKCGRKPKKTAESSEAQVSTDTVKDPKEKKVDGRTKAGRLQKINAEIEALTKKRDSLLNEYASADAMLNRMLEHIKFLRTLLSAFNALTEKGNVKLEKPEKGADYWYIRAMPPRKSFEIVDCQWNDWKSDHFRYCQGNIFLDKSICKNVCHAMNELLSEL